jgi:murein DD-endopeptidase MepM/ murein hydrolase activator NlpD
MAKKIKYFYNPHSLRFEKVKTTVKNQMLKVVAFISSSAVVGAILLFAAYYFIDSPKEKQLKLEISQYKHELEDINKQVGLLSADLSEMRERDEKIYRAIFEAEPIPSSVRQGGIGGVDRYRKLQGYANSASLIDIHKKLDQLSSQFRVQSHSFDQITQMAARKSEMLSSIPAIQPIANKNLKMIASGFGYRIDPIYKTTKMHSGMDFTAVIGTKIYATGNGVIKKAEYDRGGYGMVVVISHGYGYESLYGHMSKMAVKPGQKVQRGDVIGYVGSTGKSTGPHVHYEIIKNGTKINPVNFYFNDLSPADFDKMVQLANQSNQSFD